MPTVIDLIDRYIDGWNETDGARRRELIARTWTETATYRDPLMQGEGHSGIDAMIEQVQQRFPAHRFRRTSAIDVLHDHVRFSWELAADGAPALASGTDFGVVSSGQRLQSMVGFLDNLPAAA